MSLLHDIQAAAMDPQQSVGDLLRKCQVLAYRLQHEPLKTWVAYELGGYPSGADLPEYRRDHACVVRANLGGPGQLLRNVQVPVSYLPDPWSRTAARASFFQGVGELESMAAATTDANFRSEIPAEVFADVEIYDGFTTLQMWTVIPGAMVAGVVDQIRTRALTFALELEALDPEAGDSAGRTLQASPQSINQIFNTQVLGGTLNWASGAGHVSQTVVSVVPGDFDSLAAYLREHGVEDAELADLRAAIDADAGDGSEHEPGPRVRDWIGKLMVRIASSGGRIAESASGGLIAEGIVRFLGGA
jgi:AbiTii